MVRITEIRNAVVPISSPIANAYIDFSKMTASVVALVSDVIRDGRPVVGFGFNSNGRYACRGLLEERFIPRLKELDPEAILDGSGNVDPVLAGLEMGGNESYPDVFQPFGGFADEIAVEDGRVGLHRSPGIGFEEKANLIAAMRGATET